MCLLFCSDVCMLVVTVRRTRPACVLSCPLMHELVPQRECFWPTGERTCVVRISFIMLWQSEIMISWVWFPSSLSSVRHKLLSILPHTVHKTDKYTRNCPASQTFSYKHQRGQLTCRSLGSKQQSCNSNFLPLDGCSCSEGLYLNENGICVPMEKCPCYHNEVYIKPGKSISIKDEHWLVSCLQFGDNWLQIRNPRL